MKTASLFKFLIGLGFGLGACGSDEATPVHERAVQDRTVYASMALNPEANNDDQSNLAPNGSAVEVRSDCPSGSFCLWRDTGYNGRRVQFSSPGCHSLGGVVGFNDEASSWYNHTSHRVRIYWDSGCHGSVNSTDPSQYSPEMDDWNDEASAIYIE